MTDRERWIVYPLLFLALGSALRDKLAKQTRAKQIICEQLYLVDPEGRPVAAWQGNRLQLDIGGRGEGYLTAGVVDAETLAQRGKPVITGAGGGIPLQDLLRMLPRVQLPTVTPPKPPAAAAPNAEPVPNPPPAAEAEPPTQPTTEPPGGGPRLAPPATGV